MSECAQCGAGMRTERVLACPNPACVEHPADGTWLTTEGRRLLVIESQDDHWNPWADRHGVRTSEATNGDDDEPEPSWWWCEWR